MGSDPTEAFATRLPAAEAQRVEEALTETGWTQSQFVRTAIQHYLQTNPDDIGVLYPEHSLGRFSKELVE